MDDKRFVVETVLKQYNGNESVVTIPSDVTEIGVSAFHNTTYDKYEKLTSVIFPENLRHIGNFAFANCWELKEVVFPDSLLTIGINAFFACEKITHIHIPKNVRYIESSAFLDCFELAVITADENNSTFRAEDNCLIESATNTLVLGGITSKIPTSVTAIGKGAFAGRNIETLTIPEGVRSIGDSAFARCINKLTDMFIPASVIEIDNSAFMWCGEFTIHAPAGSYAEQYAKENNIPFMAE